MALDRFKWWSILFVSSVILLVSILERNGGTNGVSRIVAVGLVSASILFSFVGMISSVIPKQYIYPFRLESMLIWISVIFWGSTATFSSVLPSNSEESVETNVIAHPNQFFFGYLCLIASVVLLASWFKHEVQVDDSVTSTQWILLCASSFIVMVSSVGFRDRRQDVEVAGTETNSTTYPYKNITIDNVTFPITDDGILEDYWLYLDDDIDIDYNMTASSNDTTITVRTSFCVASDAFSCTHVKFGIILGGISAACALATALSSKSCAPVGCVVDLSMFLTIAWSCGVAYLTFDDGPGFALGSIYFGAFISLFLCIDILLVSLNQQDAMQEERVRSRQDRNQIVEELRSTNDTGNEFVRVSAQDIPRRDSLLSSSHYRRDSWSSQLRRTSTIDTTRRTSTRRRNDSGMSTSSFESVGAWRGSTIRNMDGEPIPSDVANATSLEGRELEVKPRDIRILELWIALLITSSICLAAIQQFLPESNHRNLLENSALAMPALSIVASFAGIAACGRHGRRFRILELGLIVLVIACWTVSLVCRSSIVDLPDREIRTGAVASANVFFCSWVSFILSIILCCHVLGASFESVHWVLLSVSAGSVFASSTLTFNEELAIETDDFFIQGKVCEVLPSYSCFRIKFGRFIGLASVIVSTAMVLIRDKASVNIRLTVGVIMCIAWSFAVVYITFGTGYGRIAGSVFFQAWSAFFLSLDIANTLIVTLIQNRHDKEFHQCEAVPEHEDDVIRSRNEDSEAMIKDVTTELTGEQCTVELHEVPDL